MSFLIQCVLCTARHSTVYPEPSQVPPTSFRALDSNEPPFTGHRVVKCAGKIDLELQNWLQMVVTWRWVQSGALLLLESAKMDLYGLCLPQSFCFWGGHVWLSSSTYPAFLRSCFFYLKYCISSTQQFGSCHQKLWMSCRQQKKILNSKGQMNCWGRNFAIFYELLQNPKKL